MVRWLLLPLFACASACSGLRTTGDPLCPEIVRFANSVEPGQAARIKLCVDWGPRCDATPGVDTIVSKRCDSDGYEPGSRLCTYLLDNSSAEFPGINFGKTLTCLGKGVHEPERYGDYDWEVARIHTQAMPGLEEGVEISIDFADGSTASPALLQIAAKAEEPPFPHDLVTKRLRQEVGESMTITTHTTCDAASRPLLTDPAFGSTHPDGAWLICDAMATRETARATLYHYLFHASLQRTLAASRIDVTLTKHGTRWRIAKWNKIAIDYPPQ